MKHARLKIFLLMLGDAGVLYASLFVMLLIRYGRGFYDAFVTSHAVPFTIIFVIWLAGLYVAGLYDLRRLRNNLDFLKTLALAITANAFVSILLFYLIPSFGVAPKRNLFIFIVVFTVLEIVWRRLFNLIAAHGEAPNRVVIIGEGTTANEVQATIRENPQLGYDVKAVLPEADAYADPGLVLRTAETHGANLIVVPRAMKHEPRLVAALYELFGQGITVSDLPTFYETVLRKVPVADLEETWFFEHIAAGTRFYDPLKRALEFAVALALGIVLLPIEILIALIVVVTSPGPAIYRQVRVGEKGKHFTLYKFRSMRADSEKHGPQWAAEHDLRATPFGGLIRNTHLDELPQLWNVVKGDISFVGPRPERPEFVETLAKKIPYYEVRLLVKPGVTGWAQINYPKDQTIDDVMQKLQYDIYYMKHRSPVLDIAIFLRTIKSFFVNPDQGT